MLAYGMKEKLICRISAALLLSVMSFFCSINQIKAYAMENVVVVIDPGHGGPGENVDAELGARFHELQEKELTLVTADAMRKELEQYENVIVHMTRAEDKAVSLKARADYAASVGADVLISLHFNASAQHNYFGSEIWVSAFGQNYATGYGLGGYFLEQFSSFGMTDKGIKTRLGSKGDDYYGVIRHGAANQIPTIIVEHGYMDNEKDWFQIDSKEKWEQLGIMDASAVAEYYGLEKGIVQENVKPPDILEVPNEPVRPDDTPPEPVTITDVFYDKEDKLLKMKISAKEPESKLLYYGFSFDEGQSFEALEAWPEADSSEGTVNVEVKPRADFRGSVMVRVYNNFEKSADSLIAALPLEAFKNEEIKENDIRQNQDDSSTQKAISIMPVDSQGNILQEQAEQQAPQEQMQQQVPPEQAEQHVENQINGDGSLWFVLGAAVLAFLIMTFVLIEKLRAEKDN